MVRRDLLLLVHLLAGIAEELVAGGTLNGGSSLLTQPEAAEEGKSSPCPNYVITFVYPRMTSSKFCEKKVPPARAFRALILPPPLVAALVEGGGRR